MLDVKSRDQIYNNLIKLKIVEYEKRKYYQSPSLKDIS